MIRFASLLAVSVVLIVPGGSNAAPPPSKLKPMEQAALDKLREIYFAEVAFKALKVVDEDHDGVGEYGSLGEMANQVPLRDDGTLLLSQVAFPFTPELGVIDSNGYGSLDGYCFALFLPAAFGTPQLEHAGGGFVAGSLDPNLAESKFIVYAWPKRSSSAARRTFAINDQGVAVGCDASFLDHHGLNTPPVGLDAYPILSFGMGTLPVDQANWLGGDGNTWLKVQ